MPAHLIFLHLLRNYYIHGNPAAIILLLIGISKIIYSEIWLDCGSKVSILAQHFVLLLARISKIIYSEICVDAKARTNICAAMCNPCGYNYREIIEVNVREPCP